MPLLEFASCATRIRYVVRFCGVNANTASPCLSVRWQVTGMFCERCLTNTSTAASSSPLASTWTAIEGGACAPTASWYQTEPPSSAQLDDGSVGATVAPTVVPDTLAGQRTENHRAVT